MQENASRSHGLTEPDACKVAEAILAVPQRCDVALVGHRDFIQDVFIGGGRAVRG